MEKLSSNSVSLAGEFAVLSELALRDVNANMTLGNTKNVDILVSNPRTKKMYRLEVKTSHGSARSKPSNSKLFGLAMYWMMGEKHEKIEDENLLYCFVHIDSAKDGTKYRFFIVPNKVVAEYVSAEHKHWRARGTDKGNPNAMRTFRIGVKNEHYPIPTPIADDYENNWSFCE